MWCDNGHKIRTISMVQNALVSSAFEFQCWVVLFKHQIQPTPCCQLLFWFEFESQIRHSKNYCSSVNNIELLPRSRGFLWCSSRAESLTLCCIGVLGRFDPNWIAEFLRFLVTLNKKKSFHWKESRCQTNAIALDVGQSSWYNCRISDQLYWFEGDSLVGSSCFQWSR